MLFCCRKYYDTEFLNETNFKRVIILEFLQIEYPENIIEIKKSNNYSLNTRFNSNGTLLLL